MDKHKYATYFWGVFLFIFLAIILSLNVSIGYWKFQKLVLGLTVRQNQMVFVSQWTMVSVKLSGINPAFLCYFGRWLKIFFGIGCYIYIFIILRQLSLWNFALRQFVPKTSNISKSWSITQKKCINRLSKTSWVF